MQTVMDPQTERQVLTELLVRLDERGPMTTRELELSANDIDQLDGQVIAGWAERGLIESTLGSDGVYRWKITDKGRARIAR